MSSQKKKIAIIGAGPTGIFTALFLKNFQGTIHVFEKNKEIGEKLKLTGGGRMNVTNKKLTSDHFFSSTQREKINFFKNPLFKKIPELFTALGTEYVWEGERAILKSGSAKTEVQRLRNMLTSQQNIKIHCNSEIIDIRKNIDKDMFSLNIKTVNNKKSENNKIENTTDQNDEKKDARKEFFDIVIATTGGMFQKNYQPNKEKTYSLFEQTEHFIVKPSPSLSPFRFIDKPLQKLSGVSFKGTLSDGKHCITDEMIITHFGLSGPAVLDFSALWGKKTDVIINFLPNFSSKKLLETLQDLRNGKNSILSFFSHQVSKRLAQFLIEKSEITKLFFADITKIEMNNLVENFTKYNISKPELFPYFGCWTTKGGVSLRDVYMHSLESKKVSHFYIGGEVLDIDGLCGGYHISLAALQGKIISESIKNS